MKFSRKFLSVLLVVCLAVCPCSTAFASNADATPAGEASLTMNEDVLPADDANVTSANTLEEITPRQTIGKLLAGGANNFYGDGYIYVYLDSGNSWADIQAGTGPSSCTGAVSISVKFPDGDWHYLGTVAANADHTIYNEFSYCPKGTYTFSFENSTNDWIQVYANIYD